MSDDGTRLDVAVLMVDDRPPMPYRVPGTPFASPSSWGQPRVPLHRDFVPPRWGTMSAERAHSMAVAAMRVAARSTSGDCARSPSPTVTALDDGTPPAPGLFPGRAGRVDMESPRPTADERAAALAVIAKLKAAPCNPRLLARTVAAVSYLSGRVELRLHASPLAIRSAVRPSSDGRVIVHFCAACSLFARLVVSRSCFGLCGPSCVSECASVT